MVYRNGCHFQVGILPHVDDTAQSTFGTRRVSQLHLELDSPCWHLLPFLLCVFHCARLPFIDWKDGHSALRPVHHISFSTKWEFRLCLFPSSALNTCLCVRKHGILSSSEAWNKILSLITSFPILALLSGENWIIKPMIYLDWLP